MASFKIFVSKIPVISSIPSQEISEIALMSLFSDKIFSKMLRKPTIFYNFKINSK